ncbi:hypothetical protein CPB83DRAFT_908901 [Crepidotus variabilis]|uniref:Uncharacterized protein n=1 Tax=Crepidotus variabilis TaxID=179855 RepID=A0A9P6EB90_9AGAR|nr:hypothetical protein CPB83DRAFT_908901 [Crepidotus variabilis]
MSRVIPTAIRSAIPCLVLGPNPPSLAMNSQIPQEIVNAIVDNLSCKAVDRTSLLACTLVSQSFSGPARRHLFSTISIRWKQNKSVEAQVRQLLSMISSRSDLRFLVRSLLIEDLGHNRSNPSVARAMDDTSDLFNLLQALTGVHSPLRALYLYCYSTSTNLYTSWQDIGVQTRSALMSIFPQLTFLRLREVREVPFTILKDMPLMETLELCQVSLEGEDEKSTLCKLGRVDTIDSLRRVTSLRVDGGLSKLLEYSTAAGLDFPKMKLFRTLVSDSEDIHAVWNLTQKFDSMNSLEMKLYTDCSYMSHSPVDLGRLSHLQSLCIRLCPLRASDNEALPHAFNLLYPPTRPTSLSTLKIVLSSPYILSSAEDFLPEQIGSSWAVLHPEKLLDVHPTLTSVEVEVDLSQSAVKWTHAPNVRPPSKAQVLSSLTKRLQKSIFGSEDPISSSSSFEKPMNIITFSLKAPGCLND